MLKMSLLFEHLAQNINPLVFFYLFAIVAQQPNCKIHKNDFQDLSYEPNIKALSQLEAENHPIASGSQGGCYAPKV